MMCTASLPINLYRIACRLTLEPAPTFSDSSNQTPVRDYYNYCLQHLKNIPPANIEDGITLMTFINNWGGAHDLVNLAREWLEEEITNAVFMFISFKCLVL